MPSVNHFIKEEFSVAIQSKFDSLQELKACSGVAVYLHCLLNTALDWDEWSVSSLGHLIPT